METTTMNTTINVSKTSMSGVILICGPDGLPPAFENAIESPFPARACLQHQTPASGKEFPVRIHPAGDGVGGKGGGSYGLAVPKTVVAVDDCG